MKAYFPSRLISPISASVRRPLTCCSAKKLSWSKPQNTDAEVVTGKRAARSQRVTKKAETKKKKNAGTTGFVDEVAWYKILVNKKDEDYFVSEMEKTISELPEIDGKQRHIKAWAPKKQITVHKDKHDIKGRKRTVRYGPLEGEVVFLECQMDMEAYVEIINHMSFKEFFHRNLLEDWLPLPCPPQELQEVHDWIEKKEKRILEEEVKAESVSPGDDEPVPDIAFEIDRLVNVNINGPVAVIDTEAEIATENGVGWDKKVAKYERKLARVERALRQRENQPEKRMTMGRWRDRNPARERQQEIERGDFEVTEWIEGPTEEDFGAGQNEPESIEQDLPYQEETKLLDEDIPGDIPPKVEEPNIFGIVGKQVVVTGGAYKECEGEIVGQIEDEMVSVKVDVMGIETVVSISRDQLKILEA